MRNHVKVARTQAGLTQEALAEAAGVSRQTINSIERGRYVPTTVLALKLARTLQQSVEQLFELEEEDLN
jgi:putative transcriptional regulator